MSEEFEFDERTTRRVAKLRKTFDELEAVLGLPKGCIDDVFRDEDWDAEHQTFTILIDHETLPLADWRPDENVPYCNPRFEHSVLGGRFLVDWQVEGQKPNRI